METTSESTHSEDGDKKGIYEYLGVDEYFRFDPLGEYLSPRLQGFRLVEGKYRPIRPRSDGSLLSQATGVVFRPDVSQLRLTDAVTGTPLLRKEEEAQARRLAEENVRQAEKNAAAEAKARRLAEKARRQAEKALQQAHEKVQALEEELARLRRQTPS